MRSYLHMTDLPEETEVGLVFTTTEALRAFVQKHTKVSDAGTHYDLVQVAAKEISLPLITQFLKTAPDYVRSGNISPEEENKGVFVRPGFVRRATAPVSKLASTDSANGVKRVSGSQHPQPLINAKTAEAKSVGGNIQYSRGDRGWRVTKSDGTETVWTSDFFRDTPVDKIKELLST